MTAWLIRMRSALMSWWQVVVVSRVGNPGVMPPDLNDIEERMAARDNKLNQLEVLLGLLNVKSDLSAGPHKRRAR